MYFRVSYLLSYSPVFILRGHSVCVQLKFIWWKRNSRTVNQKRKGTSNEQIFINKCTWVTIFVWFCCQWHEFFFSFSLAVSVAVASTRFVFVFVWVQRSRYERQQTNELKFKPIEFYQLFSSLFLSDFTFVSIQFGFVAKNEHK